MKTKEFLFVETLRDCYLYQHIVGQEPSILDLVITNEEGMVEGVEYFSPLGETDHLVISFSLTCYIQETKRVKEIYCHGKGNYTNKVRKAIRYHQKRQEREVANEAKSNPKNFWQYVNMRTKTTSGIADLATLQNTLTSKEVEKAEILANFFTSVFTNNNPDNMPTIPNIGVEEELKEYKIDPEEVMKKLSKLNPAKS